MTLTATLFRLLRLKRNVARSGLDESFCKSTRDKEAGRNTRKKKERKVAEAPRRARLRSAPLTAHGDARYTGRLRQKSCATCWHSCRTWTIAKSCKIFRLGRRMAHPPHPDLFIRDETIDAHELTVTEAAVVLRVIRPTISKLLNGKADLSPRMALRIEKAFGISHPETVIAAFASPDVRSLRRTRSGCVRVLPRRAFGRTFPP